MFTLYFITLKYVLNYTLYHKLFECTIFTLNNDPYYILHYDISFIVKLDCMWLACMYFLTGTNLKDQKLLFLIS